MEKFICTVGHSRKIKICVFCRTRSILWWCGYWWGIWFPYGRVCSMQLYGWNIPYTWDPTDFIFNISIAFCLLLTLHPTGRLVVFSRHVDLKWKVISKAQNSPFIFRRKQLVKDRSVQICASRYIVIELTEFETSYRRWEFWLSSEN